MDWTVWLVFAVGAALVLALVISSVVAYRRARAQGESRRRAAFSGITSVTTWFS